MEESNISPPQMESTTVKARQSTASPATFKGIILRLVALALLIVIQWLTASQANAKQYEFVNLKGKKEIISARVHGKAEGFVALEQEDGQLRILPQGALSDSAESPDAKPWKPVSHKEMAIQLEKKFGKERFRYYIEKPYVVGVILMAPLDKPGEKYAVSFLRKAARFMKGVETIFLKFTRNARLKTKPLVFPQVVLIFESDEDFNRYARGITGGKGISVNRIAGFYNQKSNYLNLKMTECSTFDVPLHEAIHQLAYNRQLLQRLAPIPSWFNEGLATGFESHGGRIASGPSKIHWRYANKLSKDRRVDWLSLVMDDKAFRGDILAGAAYAEGWGLHWLLANRHKSEYSKYLRLLAQKRPLEKDSAEKRLQDFESIFKTDFEPLKKQIFKELTIANRRRRPEKSKRGNIHSFIGLGEVEFNLYSTPGSNQLLRMEGKLKNISSLRSLDFYVSAKSGDVTVAEWTVRNLKRQGITPLPIRTFAPPRGVNPKSIRVSIHVKSKLPKR